QALTPRLSRIIYNAPVWTILNSLDRKIYK
ncbi:MAG: hypothetical protein ACI8PP_000875, partial [Candidatus Pseudothioglobus sp.]